MTNCYFDKKFRQLEEEWAKKLEQSGFEDIELFKNGQRYLKNNSRALFRKNQRTRLIREQYFQNLSDCLHTHVFSKELDRIVMTKFAEGITISQIVIDLKAINIEIHRQTIRYIIRRYEHEWGIRYWTAKERYLRHG